MVVEIKIVGSAAGIASGPASGDKEEKDVKFGTAAFQTLDGSQESLCQHDVRGRRCVEIAIELRIELDMATDRGTAHVYAKHHIEARPLRKVVLPFRRLIDRVEFAHECI